MKRGNGLARAVTPMSRHDLEGLPTEALLARMKRLRWCEESRENSDLSLDEVASVSHLILFKDDPEWSAAHSDLKAVLVDRGHVQNKP